MSHVFICPGPNGFYFFRSKLVTPSSKLKTWNLWTVEAQANAKVN